MTDLSPAAQKVLDAANGTSSYGPDDCLNESRWVAAAALRAAADQVVPVELHPQIYEDCCQYSDVQTRAGIRAELLAIAAELEGAGARAVGWNCSRIPNVSRWQPRM